MVHLDLVVGREIQPVELVGQHEDALLHVFEFQVGFHQLVVQGIFLILVFLGVIGPVPGHQLSLETERSGVVAHRAVVGVGIGLGRGQQFREEVVDRFRILGHAAFEHVIGIALVAQQVGDLQTRIGDFLHDLRVVELAAQRPRIAGFPEFLLQFAVRGIGHKRQVAGMLQRHGPALLAAGLGSAAMPSRTNAGSSATTFGSVMLSVNALVAASAFCPNRSVSPESSEVYLR